MAIARVLRMCTGPRISRPCRHGAWNFHFPFAFSAAQPLLGCINRVSACVDTLAAVSRRSHGKFTENGVVGSVRLGFRPYCLNVKSEERVVYKKLNSAGTLIQKTTMEAPHETLCITSDWMFTRRRS